LQWWRSCCMNCWEFHIRQVTKELARLCMSNQLQSSPFVQITQHEHYLCRKGETYKRKKVSFLGEISHRFLGQQAQRW
jgi:hypothetical protein